MVDAGGVDASEGRPPGVALCYSAAADQHAATTGFWAALGAGDRDARAAAIAALDAAATAAPDEEEFHLLLGLAHLWRLAEPLPSETSPGEQLPSALAARDHLRLAYQLCPTDHRIPAWLGPILVRFGLTHLPGMMTRAEVVERYVAASGRAVADPVFYYAYGLWKTAVVAQQIYYRFAKGLTTDPRFAIFIHGVKALSEQAARTIAAGRL